MKQTEPIRLYNLIFPIWIMLFFPGWWWLLIIPANFALDWFVLRRCMQKRGIDDPAPVLKKTAWRTCLLGFLADLIGSAALLAVFGALSFLGEHMIDTGDKERGLSLAKWAGNAMLSPWSSVSAFLITALGVLLAGFLISRFNRRMLRKRTALGDDFAKYAAKWLAIATMPYLFLLPIIIS